MSGGCGEGGRLGGASSCCYPPRGVSTSFFLQPLAGPAFFIRFSELAGLELGEGETLRLRRQTQLFFEEREHKASSRYRKAQDKARREHRSFLHTLRAGGASAYEAAAASKAAIVKSLGIDNFEELNKDTRVALMASFYAAAWDTKVNKRGTLDGVAQAAMEGAQAVGGGGEGGAGGGENVSGVAHGSGAAVGGGTLGAGTGLY